jgi:DNA/RNA endonuclease YhcR with UshA esterase domain
VRSRLRLGWRGLAALLLATAATASEAPTVTPSEAASHVGHEVVVEGLISDVGYSARSDTTFLNMGRKYPNHAFTAVIFRSAKTLFPEVRSWEGRKVRIRGLVKLYRGKPEIVLERPEQVEVVKQAPGLPK